MVFVTNIFFQFICLWLMVYVYLLMFKICDEFFTEKVFYGSIFYCIWVFVIVRKPFSTPRF